MDALKIKNLREKTGISVMACKEALQASGGNEAGALEWLKQRGVAIAEKKAGRSTKAGLVEAYVHANGRAGVLLELKSETDFVAKNPAFKDLAHNIAMHITASDPANTEELLKQPFIKDLSLTIADYVNQSIQKFGENIEIARFERFSL